MDGVLKQFDLERKDLDFHCPRNIRDSVAGELIRDSAWYLVGRTLKVSDKALDSIRDDHVNRTRPELKAVDALDAWDEEHGERGATCLKLAEALYERKKIRVLETLCKKVNLEKASKSATTPDRESQRNQICKQGAIDTSAQRVSEPNNCLCFDVHGNADDILSRDAEEECDTQFPLDVASLEQLICGQHIVGALNGIGKPELYPKPHVTRIIDKMERRFSDLVCNVRKYLQNLPGTDIDDIKLYLTTLTVSIKEDVSPCVFTSHQAEIISYCYLIQVFQWLSINGFWSFLNFHLLECLVDKYGSGNVQLKESVDAFKQDMEEFKRDTKLVDFLPAWSGRSPHISESGFQAIILRMNKDWSGCTLADVARMEGFLESRFLINRFILRFANAQPGSVVIMWLAPIHAVEYLKKKIKEIGKVSVERPEIIEVAFSDKSTLKVSSIEIQPQLCNYLVKKINEKTVTVNEEHTTLLDHGDYDQLYSLSIKDPDFFWGTLAKQFLKWEEPFETVMDCNMEKGEIKWFTDGKINVSVNCVDRHALKYPERVALIWEKDEPGQDEKVTYRQLLKYVCQIANVLKSNGVQKGDLVATYMPVCPLAVASMLACARIGAVHSVLFSSFALVNNEELRNQLLLVLERISEVITANATPLDGKLLPLKTSLEGVLDNDDMSNVQHVLVFKRTNDKVPMKAGRDEWLEEAMEGQSTECIPEPMSSEDKLFVMFTSGLTGKPKGIIHSQAGYLLHVAVTHKYYFDYQPGDIYACDADIGWVAGHSYVVYGPLCNGATTVLFDSTAVYPDPSRYWKLVQKHGINHFYTTPSVIHKLMSRDTKEIPTSFELPSLRIIASVGECLKSEAWDWFFQKFGNSKCPLIDTWWQTELGGIAISPLPKPTLLSLKNGKAMKPSFGVIPCLIDKEIEKTGNKVTGELYLEAPLPGMGRSLTGDRGLEIFKKDYFQNKNGKTLFYTSDITHRDEDGDYQMYGRSDDAIRYHGELLNLPLIEGVAKASHKSIEETLLVKPNDKGDPNKTEALEPNLVAHVEVKCKLPDQIKEEVKQVVQESIMKENKRINKESLEVQLHLPNTLTMPDNKTFSGKTKRSHLRTIDLKWLNQDQPQEEPFGMQSHILRNGAQMQACY